MPGVNLVSRHSKKAKQTNKTPHKAFSVLVEPYNIASPSYTTWRATHSRQHHDRSSGIHLGHLWRLQISCEFLACVIAQQRVQPIVGNPLTEHYQLFVRAYVRADQQVLSLKKKEKKRKKSGWKSLLQQRQSEGKLDHCGPLFPGCADMREMLAAIGRCR